MTTSCAVCRKTIATLDEGITISALGRPLFTVHKSPCHAYVNAGLQLASFAAFKGLHAHLAVKAPRVLQVVEKLNQLRLGTGTGPTNS